MKTLLLCGYRLKDDSELALGVKRETPQLNLIEHRLRQLREFDQEVICVVSGADADAQLRHCPAIQNAELIYDTNDPISLLSNARAGIFAAPREAYFVLPLEVPPPPPEVWAFLKNEYGKAGFATPLALIQAVASVEGAPCHHGFPLLLTRTGAKLLQETPDLRSLVDPRLPYGHFEL